MSFMRSGNSRGGYAPRRGRGGSTRPFVKRQEPVKPDLDKYPLGELLLTLRPSDLMPPTTGLPSSPHINDCQYVTSYNWLASQDRTILVPGQPPKWTPPKVAQRLPEDSGSYYRDPNAARYPEYPIAPAVQAVMDATDDAPIDADVFACGSTLGNLLRFTRGMDRAFRFNVETIGDTVFLVRKENDPKELIEGVRGFGHTFPEAYTTWPKEVKGSETHQRIIQYDLGGLQCLVRFECDGFLDDSPAPNKLAPSTAKPPTAPPSEDILSQALSSTTVTTPQTTSKQPLTILHTGTPIPQSSIFDLKTRSGRYNKTINMDDITPQLWLKQVPNFIVAYHDGAGLFQPPQITDTRPLISAFETANAEPIRRLIALLTKIIDVARADDTRGLEVYCPGANALEIRRQFGDGVRALPAALHAQWVARCDGGGLALDGGDSGHGASPRGMGGKWSASSDGEDDELDFTACSAEDCGYCGRCTY
ncbi:hypothetical protein C7974DRAFT_472936 [Boeremia exigua]|uniref:uncharacterized protein n=1 Tax=Boeremia exigua TaxID=749465 RepID=UPI001E8DE9FD|nr:uncharacterized protein C7974DRAFT_472936 [Boeremia exigua]KAH6625604.1 hypothetical protein C7974DRAFT_472936 [Boeremia exigua]